MNGTTYNGAMPPMAFLTDEEIATALSFVRTSWGNTGTEIKPEQVAKVRGQAGTP